MKYMEITKEFTEKFFDLAESSKDVVITAHSSPDGDSISCVLAMYRILSDRYPDKKVRVVYSGSPDEHFSYFQNFEKIQWAKDMTERLEECDLLIMLDCSQYRRFTGFPEKLSGVKNQVYIDHHASEPGDCTLGISVPEMPSCSELVFRLFEDALKLDKNLAETFLLGIISDTGSFTFLDSSQSETFLIAKKLVDAGGINISELKSKYLFITDREFTLLQEFIRNTSFGEMPNWPPFQYTYARREFVEENKYTNNELSAASKAYIAGYMGSLKGYSWGFVIRPKSSFCGVSFRSLLGGVNVRKISEKMELGGGHDRAAGGIFRDEKDPKKCADLILEWMKSNKPDFD